MRVVTVVSPRELRLENTPAPSLGPGEVLVRIKAVGICGSDLQYYTQGRIGDLQFTSGHILGHEENDMMRAMILGVPPAAPTNLTYSVQSGTTLTSHAVKLIWTDNSLNETGFTVQRSITAPPNASWTKVGTGAANPGIGGVATFVDTTVNRNTNYWYQVFADNLVGYTQVYAAPAVGYPTIDAVSAPTNVVTIMTPSGFAKVTATRFR